MEPRLLTLGHSPDPDDAFMFYALARGLVPTGGYRFEHILQDIQTLNERATRGELDITAISFHAYPCVSGAYALLPCGASMGEGYGPLVVAPRVLSRDDLAGRRVAVPGLMTSAYLAFQLWLGALRLRCEPVVVPFDAIFQAIHTGRADAGLIIHEGQLTWDREGLAVCVDLGRWWAAEHRGLPLPLGGNVIHKRIPSRERRAIAQVLSASIRYSLDHRHEAVDYALSFGRGLDRDLADRFVGMYVNHWTLDYGEKGREAIATFLELGRQAGLVPRSPALEWVA